MNQNDKVVVRVEYEEYEKKKVCYGEVEEKKIKNFDKGEDGFICVENDGTITWLNKDSVISVETLYLAKILPLKAKITDYSGSEGKPEKDAGICS